MADEYIAGGTSPGRILIEDLEQTCSGARRSAWIVAAVLLGLAAWIVAVRWRYHTEPMDCDVATYVLIGRGLAHGQHLYVDSIEFKPPGAFIIWMVVEQTIGTGLRAIFAVNIFTALCTMGGVFCAARSLAGSTPAALWACAAWALMSGDAFVQANQPNMEVFINCAVVWAFALLIARHERGAQWIAAGLLCGCAVLLKQHVGVLLAFIGLVWIAARWITGERKNLARAALLIALSGSAVGASVVLYFAAVGRLQAFYNCVVVLARYYADSQGANAGGRTSTIFQNVWNGLLDDQSWQMFQHLAPLVLLSIFGVYLLMRRGWTSRAAALLAWMVGVPIVNALGSTSFPHYTQLCLPPLCLATGACLALLPLTTRSIAAVSVLGVMGFSVVTAYADSPEQLSDRTFQCPLFVEGRSLGKSIAARTKPEQSIFIWGSDFSIDYYARRPLAGGGMIWANWLREGPLSAALTKQTLARLRADPPAYFIVDSGSASAKNPILDWGLSNYVPVTGWSTSSYFHVFGRSDGTANRMASK